jgi:hypothetical protein
MRIITSPSRINAFEGALSRVVRSSCSRNGRLVHAHKSQNQTQSADCDHSWRSARCSRKRYEVQVCRNISAPITIRCIGFINGRPTFEFWRLQKLRRFRTRPWSHPFVKRLIGTIRRECLDQMLFWTAMDLEVKLDAFRHYYNGYRGHAGLKGETPVATSESRGASLKSYRWRQHCGGLHQTPMAA